MRKFHLGLAALMVSALTCAAQAARINLPDAGWSVNWSDANSSVMSVTDAGSTASQAHIALTFIFNDDSLDANGFFNPLPIVFNQIAPTVATQLVIDTTLVNQTSVPFDGIRILLLNGANTQFDVAGMDIGQPGGLDPTPFTATLSPDNKAMYLTDGNVPSGQSFTLSQSVGVMVASGPGNQGNNAFTLKINPTPGDPTPVPEPASLSIIALGMMLVMVRRRGESNV